MIKIFKIQAKRLNLEEIRDIPLMYIQIKRLRKVLENNSIGVCPSCPSLKVHSREPKGIPLSLDQGLAHFFCQGPENKYFKLHGSKRSLGKPSTVHK